MMKRIKLLVDAHISYFCWFGSEFAKGFVAHHFFKLMDPRAEKTKHFLKISNLEKVFFVIVAIILIENLTLFFLVLLVAQTFLITLAFLRALVWKKAPYFSLFNCFIFFNIALHLLVFLIN